jgi:catechol 2,3-dioxygenase-like lactoylglutathione lyase family enzyme
MDAVTTPAAIVIRGLDHVVLRVRQLGPMLQFYCDVLGCREERRVESAGLVQLRAGHSLLDLVYRTDSAARDTWLPPGNAARNMDHFCLRLESFDANAIRQHLDAHGVRAGDLATRYGAEGTGPSLYIHDPEGNVVELKGPPSVVTPPLAPASHSLR